GSELAVEHAGGLLCVRVLGGLEEEPPVHPDVGAPVDVDVVAAVGERRAVRARGARDPPLAPRRLRSDSPWFSWFMYHNKT
ncbi:hypothetical protein THAOC_27544, partial [Thalassiosira oceanica]